MACRRPSDLIEASFMLRLLGAGLGRRYRLPPGARQAGEAGQQRRDDDGGGAEPGDAPEVFRGPAAADQQQVGGDDAPDDLGMAEAALHGALVEMLQVR